METNPLWTAHGSPHIHELELTPRQTPRRSPSLPLRHPSSLRNRCQSTVNSNSNAREPPATEQKQRRREPLIHQPPRLSSTCHLSMIHFMSHSTLPERPCFCMSYSCPTLPVDRPRYRYAFTLAPPLFLLPGACLATSFRSCIPDGVQPHSSEMVVGTASRAVDTDHTHPTRDIIF